MSKQLVFSTNIKPLERSLSYKDNWNPLSPQIRSQFDTNGNGFRSEFAGRGGANTFCLRLGSLLQISKVSGIGLAPCRSVRVT